MKIGIIALVAVAVHWIGCSGQRDPAGAFKPIYTMRAKNERKPTTAPRRPPFVRVPCCWRIQS